MIKIAKLIPVLLIFLLIIPTFSLAGQFTVSRVYDGDTVKAQGHDIEIKVRLVGIDAPETSKKKRDPGQPFSQKAKKYLTDFVLNNTVELKGYGLGPYNRILGVIFLVNGININLEMVKAGLAEVYRGKPPRAFDIHLYLQAEKEAREGKRGMWSLGDKYISPKEFRNMHRKKG